jgi:hypothetical protein
MIGSMLGRALCQEQGLCEACDNWFKVIDRQSLFSDLAAAQVHLRCKVCVFALFLGHIGTTVWQRSTLFASVLHFVCWAGSCCVLHPLCHS